jgi:hypothetical protein
VHQATDSPIAAKALKRIAALYAIETTIRGQMADTRQGVRRAQSLPLVGAMKLWLETQLHHIPPRGGLADAIRYAGSDGGAVRWATVASLLATAKLNEMEPFAYLKDVLERMSNGYPMSYIDELLPWNWRSSNAAA